MFDDLFSAGLSLATAVKNLTFTKDGNVFEPETNKVTTIGIKRKKVWLMCDGQGNMRVRSLEDPLKTIEQLSKLKDKGRITEEDFQRVKTRLLDQLGD